jgi:hypothetical protein
MKKAGTDHFTGTDLRYRHSRGDQNETHSLELSCGRKGGKACVVSDAFIMPFVPDPNYWSGVAELLLQRSPQPVPSGSLKWDTHLLSLLSDL